MFHGLGALLCISPFLSILGTSAGGSESVGPMVATPQVGAALCWWAADSLACAGSPQSLSSLDSPLLGSRTLPGA